MSRIRRPKSKRRSTRMREGIKKKVSAKQRKDRKIAKKDQTWKSRHPKDIGIPSSFPYKEKLIEDIENRKVEREQELERRKEEKRLQKEAEGGMVDDEQIEEEVEEEVKQDGMAALLESAQKAAEEYEGGENGLGDDKMEDDSGFEVVDYEIEDDDNLEGGVEEHSRKQFDKVFKTVVDASDVVLYVMDARDPEATRSRSVEDEVLKSKDKRLIFVLTKVDLVPDEVLQGWVKYLSQYFPTVPVKSSPGATNSKAFNKKMTRASTAGKLLQALKLYAEKSNLGRAITVGVIGLPNVGKSSVINALTTRRGQSGKACPVGNEAGVTRGLREIKMDNKLKILDSPGIVFPDKRGKTAAERRKFNAQLTLLNAVPSKGKKDPEEAVRVLIQRLAKQNEMSDNFKQYYKLPALPSQNLDEFVKQVLIHVARSSGRLGRGGIPNLEAAAFIILNDWSVGRIYGWTSAPAVTAAAPPTEKEKSAPVGQTSVVSQWSKEFDLDSLFADVFN